MNFILYTIAKIFFKIYFQINVFETYQIFVIVLHYITETCKEIVKKVYKNKICPTAKTSHHDCRPHEGHKLYCSS